MSRSITIEDLYSIKFLSRPRISPDGQRVAFVLTTIDERKHEYRSSIWVAPTNGGEARRFTTGNGNSLPKVRVIDRLFYRLDGVGFIYDRRQHLFMIDAAGGEPTQLTDGDWDDKDPAWSPDGTHIAFTSSRAEDRWRIPCPDIYTLSIQKDHAGELQCLTDGTHPSYSPSWSPDGKTIAFLAKPKLRSGNHSELFIIDANAAQAALSCLTSEFEGGCSDWTNSDMTDEQLIPAPVWSPDGKTLYILAVQRGSTRVYAIDAEGAGKQPPTLTPGKMHVLDFSFDQDRNTGAILIENPTNVAEIFVSSMSSPGELRRLTHINDALFDELTLATPEYMFFSGVDGWPMDGWILKPRDFDPGKKYPLIVEIHGGPNTQYGYGFMHEMQMLAAAGYVVLFTNPRGSLGYGREFALAVRGAWAEKDSLDIMAGVDSLLQKGYIDEQRLGVIGGSYGGFMTSWLIGHTDRFKAAVADRSVIDRFSFFGSSDIGWDFTDDDMEVTPWDDPERYMRMSPISYVKHIHTPLLIIHSENDLRCNIEQSEQLFAALKYIGREVLFVRFEGQSHGLSRGGHPKLRQERLRHIRAWFEKHL